MIAEEAFEMAVEGAGLEDDGAVGPAFDILDDCVAVTGLSVDGDQDEERSGLRGRKSPGGRGMIYGQSVHRKGWNAGYYRRSPPRGWMLLLDKA
jgi:hypothetical protein